MASSPSSTPPPPRALPSTVRVGDRVLVEGTSKWWPGGNYLAVVADVGLDGSVKVRYADGGFKRFSRADFERLSTPAQAHHEALEEADSAASGDDVIALEEEEPRVAPAKVAGRLCPAVLKHSKTLYDVPKTPYNTLQTKSI